MNRAQKSGVNGLGSGNEIALRSFAGKCLRLRCVNGRATMRRFNACLLRKEAAGSAKPEIRILPKKFIKTHIVRTITGEIQTHHTVDDV